MINFKLEFFFKAFPVIGRALPITISVAMFAMIFGVILGTIITFIRRSKIVWLKKIFEVYVSFFRGTPLMVQMFIFFFGLPQLIPALARINAYYASILVMSINASAYASEVIRSSLNAVDNGQYEAALSVGMSKFQAMERIILPQGFRIAVPSLGNTFIGLIQGTAITFMLGLQDIMGVSKMKAAASYRFFETYLAVGIIYWAITSLAAWLNRYLEKQLSYGMEVKEVN